MHIFVQNASSITAEMLRWDFTAYLGNAQLINNTNLQNDCVCTSACNKVTEPNTNDLPDIIKVFWGKKEEKSTIHFISDSLLSFDRNTCPRNKLCVCGVHQTKKRRKQDHGRRGEGFIWDREGLCFGDSTRFIWRRYPVEFTGIVGTA